MRPKWLWFFYMNKQMYDTSVLLIVYYWPFLWSWMNLGQDVPYTSITCIYVHCRHLQLPICPMLSFLYMDNDRYLYKQFCRVYMINTAFNMKGFCKSSSFYEAWHTVLGNFWIELVTGFASGDTITHTKKGQ